MNTELLKSKLLEAAFNGSLTHADTSKWKKVKLGEKCEFKQGIQRDIALQSEVCEEGMVRFLRIVDFTQGKDAPRYIKNPGNKYLMSESDIAVVRYGTVGFVCRGLEGALANNMFQVIPIDDLLTKDYLFWYLSSPLFQAPVRLSGKGTSMQAISFGQIKNLFLPLPPVSEQKTIVSSLEEGIAAIDAIAEAKENLATTAEMLRAKILQAAFNGTLTGGEKNNWERIRLGDVGTIVTGSTPSKAHSEYYGNDFPFYKPSDLVAGTKVDTAEDNLSKIGWRQARHLPAYSVLVTCVASVGKTGLILKEGSCNQQINAIIPNNNCDSYYLYYMMISPSIQERIKFLSRSTTVSIINKTKFSSIEIPLPPLDEQKRIVAKIEELFGEIDKISK